MKPLGLEIMDKNSKNKVTQPRDTILENRKMSKEADRKKNA